MWNHCQVNAGDNDRFCASAMYRQGNHIQTSESAMATGRHMDSSYPASRIAVVMHPFRTSVVAMRNRDGKLVDPLRRYGMKDELGAPAALRGLPLPQRPELMAVCPEDETVGASLVLCPTMSGCVGSQLPVPPGPRARKTSP